jgi:hypothetical protein
MQYAIARPNSVLRLWQLSELLLCACRRCRLGHPFDQVQRVQRNSIAGRRPVEPIRVLPMAGRSAYQGRAQAVTQIKTIINTALKYLVCARPDIT